MIMNGQLNQRPDLVIFDMDGLILDSERLFMEQERIVCLQYGYDMTPENYISTIGTAGETLRKILRDLYGEDYPMEKISRESRERVNRIIEAQGPPVKPGIGELMETLYRNKIPFCICTSTETDTATHYMEMAGFLPYLQFLKGGEQVTRSKPDPEIFLQACEKAGVRPEGCLVLEDSPNGIRAALAAGMQVIAIPDLVPVPEELKDRVTVEVVSAEEIPALMGLN